MSRKCLTGMSAVAFIVFSALVAVLEMIDINGGIRAIYASAVVGSFIAGIGFFVGAVNMGSEEVPTATKKFRIASKQRFFAAPDHSVSAQAVSARLNREYALDALLSSAAGVPIGAFVGCCIAHYYVRIRNNFVVSQALEVSFYAFFAVSGILTVVVVWYYSLPMMRRSDVQKTRVMPIVKIDQGYLDSLRGFNRKA